MTSMYAIYNQHTITCTRMHFWHFKKCSNKIINILIPIIVHENVIAIQFFFA